MSTKPTRTPVVDEYLASMMEPVTKLKEGFNPMTDNDLHKALHGHHGSADRGSREAPRSAVVPSPARPLTARVCARTDDPPADAGTTDSLRVRLTITHAFRRPSTLECALS